MGGYSEYNLADHVGDEPQAVRSNRAKLRDDLSLPAEPVWLEQVHSNKVVRADEISAGQIVQADASFTAKKGVVCVVMTADCLPVLSVTRRVRKWPLHTPVGAVCMRA